MVTETIDIPEEAEVEITENDTEVVVEYKEPKKIVFEDKDGSEVVLYESDEFEVVETTSDLYENSMFVSTPLNCGVNKTITNTAIVEDNAKYDRGWYFVEMPVE